MGNVKSAYPYMKNHMTREVTDLNIELLKYVLEVERAGSISQAADNLYLGQPNLSKAIKELEQTLNIKLFKRTSKGVSATEKGREFLRHAKIIIDQYEEIEALGQNREAGSHRLHLCAPHTDYVTGAVASFLNEWSGQDQIHIEWIDTDSLHAIRQVAERSADLGIIRCNDEQRSHVARILTGNDLKWKKILTFRPMVIMAADHPLADTDVITLQELLAYTELVPDTAVPADSFRGSGLVTQSTKVSRKVYLSGGGELFDLLTQIRGAYILGNPLKKDTLKRFDLVQKDVEAGGVCHDLLIYRNGHAFRIGESVFLSELFAAVAR